MLMRRPIPCGGFPPRMACGKNDDAAHHTKDNELHGFDRYGRFTALFGLLYLRAPLFFFLAYNGHLILSNKLP